MTGMHCYQSYDVALNLMIFLIFVLFFIFYLYISLLKPLCSRRGFLKPPFPQLYYLSAWEVCVCGGGLSVRVSLTPSPWLDNASSVINQPQM